MKLKSNSARPHRQSDRSSTKINWANRPNHYNTVAIVVIAIAVIIAWNTGRTDIGQLRKQVEVNRAGLSLAQYEANMAREESAVLNDRVSTLEAEVINQAARITAHEDKPKTAAKTAKAQSPKSSTYKITFYCSCAKCCGKSNGITASGAKVKAGRTVAAPKSFKFGTRLYIEGIGERIVEDRGGSIKGNRLDVYVGSHAEAMRLGVRTAKVTVR